MKGREGGEVVKKRRGQIFIYIKVCSCTCLWELESGRIIVCDRERERERDGNRRSEMTEKDTERCRL